jgi:hypothetical protein
MSTYEADLVVSVRENKLSFDFTFRFIDDGVSLNTSKVCDYVDRIYLIEREIRVTTDTTRSKDSLFSLP